MATKIKTTPIPAAPTGTGIVYPEEDGEPMAVSDLHRQILTWVLHALEAHFTKIPGVYVSGDILMYYVEGNPQKVISPDVLVTFGIGQKLRRTYKVWEEGKVPEFVMEFSSKTTYRNDLGEKRALYALLGIENYLLYDAEGLYLPSPLMGFTLVDGDYVPISPDAAGGVHASALGLDFHIRETGLGIYDPATNEWLQTLGEAAVVRAEQEAIARKAAESEVDRLREELARLRAGA